MVDWAVRGDNMEKCSSFEFLSNATDTKLVEGNRGILVKCCNCNALIVTTAHRYIRGETLHHCYRNRDNNPKPKDTKGQSK